MARMRLNVRYFRVLKIRKTVNLIENLSLYFLFLDFFYLFVFQIFFT